MVRAGAMTNEIGSRMTTASPAEIPRDTTDTDADTRARSRNPPSLRTSPCASREIGDNNRIGALAMSSRLAEGTPQIVPHSSAVATVNAAPPAPKSRAIEVSEELSRSDNLSARMAAWAMPPFVSKPTSAVTEAATAYAPKPAAEISRDVTAT
ncbi:hypothetical protein GCM10009803_12530 [Microbacterium ginsengiterrae]